MSRWISNDVLVQVLRGVVFESLRGLDPSLTGEEVSMVWVGFLVI